MHSASADDHSAVEPPPYCPRPTLPRPMSADTGYSHSLRFTHTPITLFPKKFLVSQCSVKCYQFICASHNSAFTACWYIECFIHLHRKFGRTVYYVYGGAYKNNFITFFSLYSLCFSHRNIQADLLSNLRLILFNYVWHFSHNVPFNFFSVPVPSRCRSSF